MRGTDHCSGSLFSYVDIEARVPQEHPLRRVRELVNSALLKLDKRFGELYSKDGRPSIAPERLLRASLLQLFYSIRSERQLMEGMDFDLLFRWFVGLGIDDPVWDHSVFSKNRDRLLNTEIAQDFLAALLAEPKVKRLLSHEHFSVADVMANRISGARSAATIRTKARQTPTHGSIARATAGRVGFATWATRSWKTAMASPFVAT